MNIIPQIAEAIQTVLTTTADYAGRLTGFVNYYWNLHRRLSGAYFPLSTFPFSTNGSPLS